MDETLPRMDRGITKKKHLPDGIPRCIGVGSDDEGWREGCEDCARRLDIDPIKYYYFTEPPYIIAFWCEFLYRSKQLKCQV